MCVDVVKMVRTPNVKIASKLIVTYINSYIYDKYIAWEFYSILLALLVDSDILLSSFALVSVIAHNRKYYAVNNREG
jgi:hypothetical protein